jgi:hypothetical protein
MYNVFFPDFFTLRKNRGMKKKTYAGLEHGDTEVQKTGLWLYKARLAFQLRLPPLKNTVSGGIAITCRQHLLDENICLSEKYHAYKK